MSGIKQLRINFTLLTSEKTLEKWSEEDLEELKNDKMMEEIEKTNGKFWFTLFKVDESILTEQQITLLEQCLQTNESDRPDNILYKLKNAF